MIINNHEIITDLFTVKQIIDEKPINKNLSYFLIDRCYIIHNNYNPLWSGYLFEKLRNLPYYRIQNIINGEVIINIFDINGQDLAPGLIIRDIKEQTTSKGFYIVRVLDDNGINLHRYKLTKTEFRDITNTYF
jgi:hypothetical protein